MTTVADLVAKLGFQVDTKGFDNFKKSLESFQSIVRDGLKDLKEYAKQAERITKAMRESFVPNRNEAEKRFKAETYAIRARAFSQRMRARYLPETLSIRKQNADIRERQTRLREAGISSGYALSGSKFEGTAKFISSISSVLSGGIGGLITALATLINPILGAITSLGVTIVGGFMKVGAWIWGQVKQGLAYAMAFRDYRSFTGRNTKGLNNLMGMTNWTTSMTPQDVMKDAAAMGREYWDMWFGGGNPAIWQLLGVMPTMNGETNLKNLLSSIYGVSGKGKNKGLALSLLKQAGLSEDYMNIFYHWDDYVAGGGEKSFQGYTDEQIRNMEEANKALREFGIALDQVRVYFVDALLKSGLKDALKDIADYFLGLIQAFRAKKIHDVSSLLRHVFDFERMVESGRTGQYQYRSGWEKRKDAFKEGKLLIEKDPTWFNKMLSNVVNSLIDKVAGNVLDGIVSGQNPMITNTINNNFDMAGRDMGEAVNGSNEIIGNQTSNLFRGLSNDTVMVGSNSY